jgi:sugar phosphate isomerase/epimerase
MKRSRFDASRRRLLRSGALAGLALVSGSRLGAASDATTRWTPGLQLYTLGDAAARDLDGTLEQIAAIGYRAVELAGHYGRPAVDLRWSLDRVGLVCTSAHLGARPQSGNWSLQDDPEKLVADLRTLGAAYAVLPAPLPPAAEPFRSEDWKRTAHFLNEKGAMLARSGLRIAYHNHATEFERSADAPSGFEILLADTDPKCVDFQLDVGWATAARQDIARLFAIAGDRIRLLHLKDTRPSPSVPRLVSTNVGTGIVDWRSLVRLVRTHDIRYAYVEQEPPFPGPPMNSVRAAYEFLSVAFAEDR